MYIVIIIILIAIKINSSNSSLLSGICPENVKIRKCIYIYKTYLTAQLSLDNTAQRSVTPHYNAYDVVEAKSIKRISTNLQNKQAQIS